MPQPSMKRLLPPVDVSRADGSMLQQLAATLVARNVDQCHALALTSDGFVRDTARWRELRKAERVRIYEERATSEDEYAGDDRLIPSLLLVGTLAGSVDDVMLAAVAPTDAELQLQSRFTDDGVAEGKVLHTIVPRSTDDPFRHVSVTWRRFDTRDYVCVDASGFVKRAGERVGFCVSHSISFQSSALPVFERQSIDRGNRSVCALYRQRGPREVACYVRGFFDLETDCDFVTHSVMMQNVATQWLSFARLPDLALLKKLQWLGDPRRRRLQSPRGYHQYSSADRDRDRKLAKKMLKAAASECSHCAKGFGASLLLGGAKLCTLCGHAVCSKCCVKKHASSPSHSAEIKKRTVCTPCLREAERCDAEELARELQQAREDAQCP